MPKNPNRKAQGGDVEGTRATDTQWSVGDPVQVANASFDPGYPLANSLDYLYEADLVQGYCGYGRATGEDDGSFMRETRGKGVGHRKNAGEANT